MNDRNRASGPTKLPPREWPMVARRIKAEVKKDNVSIVAAGVAFYAFLAIFPALAALLALYGLVADPAQVSQQIDSLGGVLPPEVIGTLGAQAERLTTGSSDALSWGLALSVLLAVWSANKGTKALLQAITIAYDTPEERGFVKLNAVSLAFTIAGILTLVVALGAVVIVPAVSSLLGLGGWGEVLVRWLRWPALLVMLIVGLAFVYRYGPCRPKPAWRWITPGSVLATVLWLIGSAAFSLYVSSFGNYNETFGSLAAVVILLLWFFLSAMAVLLGAEANNVIESQAGPPAPGGARGQAAGRAEGPRERREDRAA